MMIRVVLAALTLALSAGVANAQPDSWVQMLPNHGVAVTAVAPRVTHAGWQGVYLYTVPTGATSLEFTYGCPSAFPNVVSGGYEFVGNAQFDQPVDLTASAPRLDESVKTAFQAWADHFYFPNGALAGTQIWFDAYCK